MGQVKDEDDRDVEIFDDAPDYDGPQQRDGMQDTIEEADDA